MQEALSTNNRSKQTTRLLVLGTIILALLFFVGCRNEEPSEEEQPTAETTEVETEETAVPTEAAVEPTAAPEEVEEEPVLDAAAIPAIDGEIAVTSDSAVNVTSIAEADLASANIESLPTNVTLVGHVYGVESDDTAVTGQVALNTPADVEANQLDLYGWDGSSWHFVPSQFDVASQQRISADQTLFQAYMLGQATVPDTPTVGGIWREEADEANDLLTEAVVGSIYLNSDGTIDNALDDAPSGVANAYIQLTNLHNEPDADALAALLADETLQAEQVDAIVSLVEPYAGVNLNYQGVDASQQEAFTTFVQNLGEALQAEEKNLILTLPSELNNGYDLVALGDVANSVYLQLPQDPNAYAAETVDSLLTEATDQIDRRKLVAFIPTHAVIQSGDNYLPLTHEELLSHFGDVELTTENEELTTETAVELTLSSNISDMAKDESSAAYTYNVENEDGETVQVWLPTTDTIANRINSLGNHNLQGVAFTTPAQLADAPLVWTVLDSEENVVATEASNEASFSWEGTEEAGDYSFVVDLVVGGESTPLATLPMTIVASETDGETAVSAADGELVSTIGVVKQNANVRVGPGESYDAFPGPVLKDAEVEIVGRDEFGYWLQILFSNIDGEQTGWIATSLINLDADFDIDTLADATEIISDLPANVVAEAPSAPTEPEPEATTPPPPPSSGPPPPVSAPPVAVGGFELGGQTHSFSNPSLMAASGMTWVKFQHKWGEGSNPNDLAGRIANAHGAGFKVLLSIPGANTYPESINFEAYVQFLAGVAALGPDAIEVWNEMNIDFEWPAGQISPDSYVNDMLAPAYNAIKSANPNVMVISGAPAPTGFDNNTNAWADNRYMAGMLAAGGGNYADCIGAHYNAGASSPSTVSGHPTGSAHYSWYLLPTLNVYAQFGRPVCFTELGYLSGADYGGVPERFAWAANTSVEQHAAWLAEAVSVAANTGRVRMIIVFNVDFTHWGDDPQAGYAMIRKNGGCPACETLAQVMGR